MAADSHLERLRIRRPAPAGCKSENWTQPQTKILKKKPESGARLVGARVIGSWGSFRRFDAPVRLVSRRRQGISGTPGRPFGARNQRAACSRRGAGDFPERARTASTREGAQRLELGGRRRAGMGRCSGQSKLPRVFGVCIRIELPGRGPAVAGAARFSRQSP